MIRIMKQKIKILKLMSMLGIAIGIWCLFNILFIQQSKMYFESIGGWGYFASIYLIVFGIFGVVYSNREMKNKK
jgi:prolipoprotein diacylglyceryltransferase